MNLTPGESLILKMIINLQTDVAVFRDLAMAKLKVEELKTKEEIEQYNAMTHKYRLEKQAEIVAQLKNLYSEKLGTIDDLLDDVLNS